ncbi:non-hydrolyzing UDP-N-acetylglucosamine 2-epimerase [Saliphagus sp. GCM10025308]
MKVLTVVGARPQFVKASAVSRALNASGHDEKLVHTGQHYDEELSDVFFEELEIPDPAYELGVGSASHGAQTAAMIDGIEPVVAEVEPDVIVLYGDTNSTLAGAIVGSKVDATVAHVEAGLRSFTDMPEEVNRRLTDHAADLLFAPTAGAVANLAAEGLEEGVYRSGDVMYDVLLRVVNRSTGRSTILERLEVMPGNYVLATVHRERNTDDPVRLRSIVDALSTSSLPVIFPAHPRTIDRLERNDLLERARRELHLTEPVGYLDFIRLLDEADRVVTDSGGVQKEAFFLDTPCITLREETEWAETVECGWNELVGTDRRAIERALVRERSLEDKPSPYGDGRAAKSIVEVLERAR